MSNSLLVAVVEDDGSFRDSMGMLLTSFGYSVEAFPSAADFLASPRVRQTACLIADVNGVDRVRGLNGGVVGYLRKAVDDQHLIGGLRAALASHGPPEES